MHMIKTFNWILKRKFYNWAVIRVCLLNLLGHICCK